jgi:hypothetical protein
MLVNRLSIPRSDWVHDYCCLNKEGLPKKKKERQKALAPNIESLQHNIRLREPCIIVGMGKLPCEVLTGASLVSTKAGTCWKTKNYGKVWITYSPDAALFDPALTVDIYGVLAKAARAAGIATRFDKSVKMFSWEDYERQKY